MHTAMGKLPDPPPGDPLDPMWGEARGLCLPRAITKYPRLGAYMTDIYLPQPLRPEVRDQGQDGVVCSW